MLSVCVYFALVLEGLEKPEVETFEIPEVEIPEMDLYILRDSNVRIDAWFDDAGNGAASGNPVPYTSLKQQIEKLHTVHLKLYKPQL